jgi:hypothetical protein
VETKGVARLSVFLVVENEKLAELKAEEEAKFSVLKAEEEAKLSKLKAGEAAKLVKVKAEEEAKLAKMKSASDARLAQLEPEEEERREEVKAEEDSKFAEASARAEAKLAELKVEEEEKLAEVKAEEEARQAQLKAEEGARQAQLNAVKMAKLTKLIAEEEARRANLKADEEARQTEFMAETEAKLAEIMATEDPRIAVLRTEDEARRRVIEEARRKQEEETRQREEKLRREEEARLRAEKIAKLKALEEARIKSQEEAQQHAADATKLKAEDKVRLRREAFQESSKQLRQSLRFKPPKSMLEAEAGALQEKEQRVPERQIGVLPPSLAAMILQATLELRPVPEEHKEKYRPVASDAASIGRVTRLQEVAVVAQGRKEPNAALEESARLAARTKTKTKGGRARMPRPFMGKSDSIRIVNEAAALGRMKHMREVVVQEKYDPEEFRSEELEGIDELVDEHGMRVIRTQFLTDRQVLDSKQDKSEDWLEDVDQADYENIDDVELPVSELPGFKPKQASRTEQEAREGISQAVAEGYWNRYYRLERPGAELHVTGGCSCKYCPNPNAYQTYAYQKRWADQRLSVLYPDGQIPDGDDDKQGWLTGLYLPCDEEEEEEIEEEEIPGWEYTFEGDERPKEERENEERLEEGREEEEMVEEEEEQEVEVEISEWEYAIEEEGEEEYEEEEVGQEEEYDEEVSVSSEELAELLRAIDEDETDLHSKGDADDESEVPEYYTFLPTLPPHDDEAPSKPDEPETFGESETKEAIEEVQVRYHQEAPRSLLIEQKDSSESHDASLPTTEDANSAVGYDAHEMESSTKLSLWQWLMALLRRLAAEQKGEWDEERRRRRKQKRQEKLMEKRRRDQGRRASF